MGSQRGPSQRRLSDRDRPAPFPMRITLAGPVRLWGADGAERGLPTRRARALLAYLTLADGRPVARTTLAALLWERSQEAEGRASLRKALSSLSAALQGTDPKAPDHEEQGREAQGRILLADREALRLVRSRLEVDLDHPEALAPAALLMEGLEGLGEGWDEWLSAERTRFADRRRAGAEAELQRHLATAGAAEAAMAAARRLVELDDAHEGGWRALMRLLAASGDRGRALEAYERCRAALRRGLDAEPAPETRALAHQIRAEAPEPAPTAPPPASGPARPLLLPSLPVAPLVPVPPRPDGPLRVGVLPFTATGLGAEREALALAYAREVAGELARFGRFHIVSPLALPPRDRLLAGEGTGLDYLLDGSLREGADGALLTVTLIEVSESLRHVWNESTTLPRGARGVDGTILEGLAARLDPALVLAAGSRALLPGGVGTNGTVLRALPMMLSLDPERFEQAGRLLADAVVAEPENAMATAWAAQWHVFRIGQGWTRRPEEELAEAERLASLAMRLDPTNAEAMGIYGHVCAFLHQDFDSAVHFLDRSLEMNPSQASMWAMSAATQCYRGDAAAAQQRLARYRGLAPHHPHGPLFDSLFPMAALMGGDYEAAVRAGRLAVRQAPDFINGYKTLLAALGLAGRGAEGRPYLKALLTREPGFTIRDFVRRYPFQHAEDRARYAEGLALAGAPLG